MKLPQAAKNVTKGKLINLISTDSMKLEICFLFLHAVWALPIQTSIISYIMYRNVGYAALVGVFTLLLQTIPIQGKFHFSTIFLTIMIF